MTIVSDFILYGVEEHRIDNNDNLTVLDAGTGNALKYQLTSPVIIGGTIDNAIIGQNTPNIAYFAVSDSINNSPSVPLTISHNFTNPLVNISAGFGVGMLFQADDTTTVNSLVGQIVAAWTVPTHASRSGEFDFFLSNSSGNVQAMTLTPTGINSTPIGATTASTGAFTTIGTCSLFRATGESLPASGAGVEIYYNVATPYGAIDAYDRTGSAYKLLYIDANPLDFNVNSNNPINTGTGLTKLGGKSQTAEGLSTGFASLGGTIFDHFADQGNVTTGETDLYSDSIPASALGTNGDTLVAHYGGTTVASATATREFRAYFGGTAIFDSTALTLNITGNWEMRVIVIRDSTTSVRCLVTFTVDSAVAGVAPTGPYCHYVAVSGLTLTNANILKITGQAGGAGAATNDIVAKFGKVEWKSAA